MDITDRRAIQQQAYRDFKLKKGKYLNPFPIGSDEYNIYDRSWSQAVKRHAGALPG